MTYAALFLALIATPSPNAEAVSEGTRGEPVLLNFTTTWCGYCRQMKPALEQLADAGYPIRDVDGDKNHDLAKRYKVNGYPTYVIVDESGEELARTAGLRPASELAAMYREAQGQVRQRPRTRAVSDRRDNDGYDEKDAGDDSTSAAKTVNPMPWETVVRIRMKLSGNAEGVGSGTIISSNARETIILTCAHIFKEEGRSTPAPSSYRKSIIVDLFDGQRGGPRKNQVHYVESVPGEAIDYDLTNDVGLIRIRPGKVLPFARVVPPSWSLREKMTMTTVGCSEGHDATAWSTVVLRTNAKLKNTGTGETFQVTECEHPPKQGRSGGGLFTDDGYLAGVCDFADPQHGHGLYAVPQSIYKLLDRNKMIALYDPAARNRNEPKRLLADRGVKAKVGGSYRGQSPDEELEIPPPSRLGIKPPVVAKVEETESKAGSKSWTKPGAKLASGTRRPAENVAIPSRMTREGDDDQPAPAPAAAAAAAAEDANSEDVPAAKTGPTNWKPVRRN